MKDRHTTQAAVAVRLSIGAPLAFVALRSITIIWPSSALTGVVMEVLGLVFLLGCVIIAVAALIFAKRSKQRCIIAQALIGCILNAILISFVISGIPEALRISESKKAAAQQEQLERIK